MPSTYEPISTHTLLSAINTYTLSNIPQTFTDLVLVIGSIRDSAAGSSIVAIRYNGDTGSNYSCSYIGASGAGGLFSGRRTNDTGIWLGGMYSPRGTFRINISNYSNTTTNKTSLSRQDFYGTAYEAVGAYVGLWRSTAAITSITVYSIDISPNFDVGTTFTLYGIKAA
jgi:hypothetical protein